MDRQEVAFFGKISAVDPGNSDVDLTKNEPFDWLQKRMLDRWTEW